MIALGVSTSTNRGGAALALEDGRVVGAALYDAADDHAERLFSAIDEALRRAGIGRDRIGLVACDVGPGSFTGIRVGTSALAAIAWALRVPTVPIVSLAAMAFATEEAGPVVPVLDARRGEAFFAAYADRGLVVLSEPVVASASSPDLVIELARAHGATVCGAFAATMGVAASPRSSADLPSPAAIAALAHRAPRGPLEPVYVRKPDAKTEAERAASRV